MSLSNARGVYVIAPTPFLDDGRIDNDSVDLKFRMFRNAALFSEDAIVWSNGTGS